LHSNVTVLETFLQFTCQTFNGHQTSDIRHQTSDIRHQTSDI